MSRHYNPQSVAVMLGIQNGIVFQAIGSQHLPLLAFSMSTPSYIRQRLTYLIRGFPFKDKN